MLEKSVWQRLAQSILTRTSFDFGGSTCISSIVTAFPCPQHIAATISKESYHIFTHVCVKACNKNYIKS